LIYSKFFQKICLFWQKLSANQQNCQKPTKICPETRNSRRKPEYSGIWLPKTDLYCHWIIFLFSKLYSEFKKLLHWNWARQNLKKCSEKYDIFADFALRIRNRFKLRKRSESERILKIAKRKRSEFASHKIELTSLLTILLVC